VGSVTVDIVDCGDPASKQPQPVKIQAAPNAVLPLCLSKKLLEFSFNECRVFPSVREYRSVLTCRGGFMARTPFSVSQENSIRMAAMCCLTVGGAAWRCKVSM